MDRQLQYKLTGIYTEQGVTIPTVTSRGSGFKLVHLEIALIVLSLILVNLICYSVCLIALF